MFSAKNDTVSDAIGCKPLNDTNLISKSCVVCLCLTI